MTVVIMSINKIVIVMVTAVVLSAASGLTAQQTAPHVMPDQMKMPADMAAKCKAMMAEHDKMMAATKAADEKLDSLVVKMNAASPAAKPTATASVVTEIVLQRRTMRDGMMKMEHDTMSHMMEHMQHGKDSMAMCPLMKSMGGAKH